MSTTSGSQPERRAELPADLRHLEAVGEPVADEVVRARADHLRLRRQPAQPGRVDDAGPVAGELPAPGVLRRLGHPALPVGLGVPVAARPVIPGVR